MADSDGSKALKIVLIVAGVVALLGVVCCGGLLVLNPGDWRGTFGDAVQMGRQMAAGVQKMDSGFAERFGEDGTWELGGAGSEAMLLIGVTGDVDDARAAELQDAAWELYCASFADGGMPLTAVGIGSPGKRQASGSFKGKVAGWSTHVVDVGTLVERTGVAAPPEMEFFERAQRMQEEHGVDVKVNVNGGDDDSGDDAPPVEQPPTEGE